MKRFFTITLVAIFALTTTCQTDAFAFSVSIGNIGRAIDGAIFQPIKNNVVGPVIDLVSPKTNPIIDAIVRGTKEAINLGTLAVTDWEAFRQQLRIYGDKLGIYDYSDHDFIRHVTNNEKLRQALLLLREKTPDVFRWIKSNLAMIRIENDLGNYPHSLGGGPVGAQFNFLKGRTIAFRRDMIDERSVEDTAVVIVHEVAHLVNYFEGSLQQNISRGLAENHWPEEYAADGVSTLVADRLGVGAGWRKLDAPEQRQINDINLTVTDELQSWKPGDRSTGGYWELATTALRGTRTVIQNVLPFSLNGSMAQTSRSYTTEQVEVDLTTFAVRVIGSSTATRTFLMGQNGVLRITDKTKDNNSGKETTSETEIDILSRVGSNTYNPDGKVTVTPVVVLENADGTTTFSISRINGSGDTITASVIIDKNGEYAQHVAQTTHSPTDSIPPAEYTPVPTDTNDTSNTTQTSTTTTTYNDASGKFIGTTTTIVDAAGNTTRTQTDANGRTIAVETKTGDGKGDKIVQQNVTYDDQGKIIGYTEITESAASGKTATKYSNITYAPVGGPQGGIAPDVVNTAIKQSTTQTVK